MRDPISVRIDDNDIAVSPGTSVASAIVIAGGFRRSVSGERRWPVCGMGICFECRATVDGIAHERTCMLACRPGMEIRTDG
jgi:sarcosine oxidase subunit alpha